MIRRNLQPRAGFFCGVALLMGGLTACVGPTSPFGTVPSAEKVEEGELVKAIVRRKDLDIQFHPQRQVLHDRTEFSIEINSRRPLSDKTKVILLYNGYDVTSSFLQSAHVHKSADQRQWIYVMKDLRLKTLDANDIEVRVIDPLRNRQAARKYGAPNCSFYKKSQLAHLGPFRVPASYQGMIEKVSAHHQTNPSFLAGVVAQESGFDPKAVSWAKAIGLTQMTPVAELQVIDKVKSWPRYPGINKLSYMSLRSKISRGHIDQEKEWRLDPEKSLQGGLTYFDYLHSYWQRPDNKKLLDQLTGDRDHVLTQVLLASYNSGAARVKAAIKNSQDQWKYQDNLSEALKYIRRVSSYCYHYTKHEVNNDNET